MDVLDVTETHMKGCQAEDCDARRESELWEGPGISVMQTWEHRRDD